MPLADFSSNSRVHQQQQQMRCKELQAWDYGVSVAVLNQLLVEQRWQQLEGNNACELAKLCTFIVGFCAPVHLQTKRSATHHSCPCVRVRIVANAAHQQHSR